MNLLLCVHDIVCCQTGHVTGTDEGHGTISLSDPHSPAITSYRAQEYFQQRVRTLWCTPNGLAQLVSQPS